MAKTDFKSVEEYLASLSAEVRPVMEEVRAAILAGVPGGEEVISYQIPAVKSDGWVFYYSAHAKHWSLSTPPGTALYEEFADELADYPKSKSAIRFPLDEPVPADLITRMAAFKAAENAARTSSKK